MILLKLGFLWWKLKIFIANFSDVSPNRFWRIFSMLLKSHPTIKGRWKKFCCNYFDAKPQFDWTNITPTVYSNRIVSALSLGCGWSHRRQIKGHGNGTWISVGNIPSTTTFSDVPLLPEMCCWNYPNSQCFVYKPGFPGTFCNWFTTRIEWMTENELQTVVSKMN